MKHPTLQRQMVPSAAWRMPLVVLLLLGVVPGVRGQDCFAGNCNLFLPVLSGIPLDLFEQSAPPRPHRVRLLGITPGFLADPMGLDQEDFDPSNPGVPVAQPGVDEPDTSPDWLTIAIGNDNPFLEARTPGSPGGVGYYRIFTQLQVIDSTTTACSVGVQAFTPAGWQNAGLQNGPTTLCPNVGFFQLLGTGGAAIQGFVANRVGLDNRLDGQIRQHVQYAVALQQQLWTPRTDGAGTAYLYLEAQGRYRDPLPGVATPPALWQFLPGVSWRTSDNVWLTSGVMLPIGPDRDIQQHRLQISCSFQF